MSDRPDRPARRRAPCTATSPYQQLDAMRGLGTAAPQPSLGRASSASSPDPSRSRRNTGGSAGPSSGTSATAVASRGVPAKPTALKGSSVAEDIYLAYGAAGGRERSASAALATALRSRTLSGGGGVLTLTNQQLLRRSRLRAVSTPSLRIKPDAIRQHLQDAKLEQYRNKADLEKRRASRQAFEEWSASVTEARRQRAQTERLLSRSTPHLAFGRSEDSRQQLSEAAYVEWVRKQCDQKRAAQEQKKQAEREERRRRMWARYDEEQLRNEEDRRKRVHALVKKLKAWEDQQRAAGLSTPSLTSLSAMDVSDPSSWAAWEAKLQDASQLRLFQEVLSLKKDLEKICKAKQHGDAASPTSSTSSSAARAVPAKPKQLSPEEVRQLHHQRRKRGHRRTQSHPLRFNNGQLCTDG